MIEARSVVKSYQGETVLHGVSLSVEDGEFVTLMGESGSGKSTLLRILGGFLAPDSGCVLWNGRDVTAMDDAQRASFRSREMGFVFQDFRLISTLTARDNVLLPAVLSGIPEERAAGRMNDYAEELGLSALLGKYPEELSGGQCQRAAILRALCGQPPVIILDEPTGALDRENERRVMELIARVNRESGITVVQVTHNPAVAEYGTRVIRMRDGRIC